MSTTENRLTRAELEQNIIDKSWQVDISLIDAAWLESIEFHEFMRAWSDLVAYYEVNPEDTQIGVEVLREYVDFTRLLRNIMVNEAYDEDRRKQSEDELKGIEFKLEEIIREVVGFRDSK